METVLHFSPQNKLHPAFKTLIQQMNGDGKKRGYQLSTANALWGQKGYGFLPEFSIKELFKPGILTGDTRLVLTNAIYFKGTGPARSRRTRPGKPPFLLADGKKVNVPMMFQETSFKHYWSEEFQALELPYAGKALAMLVLLPKKADGLSC